MTGDKHNSNQELVAQGIANVVTPLFGGIPATGAIARTMTNINNGGRTPVAGIWAVGDITEGHALAHRAFEQGIIAAESIAGLDPKPLDEDTIPQIVFSNPEPPASD